MRAHSFSHQHLSQRKAAKGTQRALVPKVSSPSKAQGRWWQVPWGSYEVEGSQGCRAASLSAQSPNSFFLPHSTAQAERDTSCPTCQKPPHINTESRTFQELFPNVFSRPWNEKLAEQGEQGSGEDCTQREDYSTLGLEMPSDSTSRQMENKLM